jgi:hypothetical protein
MSFDLIESYVLSQMPIFLLPAKYEVRKTDFITLAEWESGKVENREVAILTTMKEARSIVFSLR